MDLTKIYESLQLDKLDEEKQEEIKQYIDETIELKAKEIAATKVDEEKETLIEKYEKSFNEYKDEMSRKFSDFVDNLLESEMQIPEKIKEYAKKGERYEPVLEQLGTMMAIDEGTVDEKARELLKEASEELENFKNKTNELKGQVIELKEDAQEMAAHIYLRQKCDGLSESKKDRVIKLLEDVKSKDEIDRKFKIITEGYSDDDMITEKTLYCSECDKEVEITEDDDATCPDCGGSLKEKTKGKTNEELNNPKPTNENKDPMMNAWLTMIRENKF